MSYSYIHKRVRLEKGPAHNYKCSHCENTAQDWAYDHKDKNEIFDNSANMLYSQLPQHYFPLCCKCHSKFDGRGYKKNTPLWKPRDIPKVLYGPPMPKNAI